MSNLEKIIIGALGGLSSVLVKFLGQDYSNVVAHAANLTPDQLLSYKIGYSLLTPILMFLGAFIAWASEENKRLKLVAIAIAAPAMITTWSGGSKVEEIASINLLSFNVYAQSSENEIASDTLVEKSKTTFEKIKDGVGVFFGYGKEPKRYWVIVGSFKNQDSAQQYADRINAENKTLSAWVGEKVPPNQYHPVIVGGYNLLSEAKVLKEKALMAESINDAYLSPGAKR